MKRGIACGIIAIIGALMFGGCEKAPEPPKKPAVDPAAAVIVLPAESNGVEQFAADELQYHIEKATGVRLAIIAENALAGSAAKYRYYIGATAAAKAASSAKHAGS